MEAKVEQVLRERYADEKNPVLAKELGISVRTLQRRAKELGLQKSEKFMRMCRWDALMVVEWMRLCGKKVRSGGASPGGFKPGHRFSPEVEAKRIQALRDAAWDERKREIRGEPPKRGWKRSGWFGKHEKK